MDIALTADYSKIERKPKKDEYLSFAREENMNVMFIPIIIYGLGTVTKGLIKGPESLELQGRVETIQTKELLR